LDNEQTTLKSIALIIYLIKMNNYSISFPLSILALVCARSRSVASLLSS
jgi:hypothetical protein